MKVFPAVVGNDIHFDHHDPRVWDRAKDVMEDIKPVYTFYAGDLHDFESLSRYALRATSQLSVIKQIRCSVREIVECMSRWHGQHVVIRGNHDDRWEKMFSQHAHLLEGAKGLTLRDQMYAQGLPRSVRWVEENEDNPGWRHKRARVWIRHGDKQTHSWGLKNIAAASLAKFPSTRQVEGHHHRAQLMFHTELGRVSWSMANGHLSKPAHSYNITPNWQQSFALLQFYGGKTFEDCTECHPQLIVADKLGRFVYNGRVYDGRY